MSLEADNCCVHKQTSTCFLVFLQNFFFLNHFFLLQFFHFFISRTFPRLFPPIPIPADHPVRDWLLPRPIPIAQRHSTNRSRAPTTRRRALTNRGRDWSRTDQSWRRLVNAAEAIRRSRRLVYETRERWRLHNHSRVSSLP